MADEALKRLAAMRKPGLWIIAGLESVQASNGPGRYDPGWFHPSDFGNECDAFLAFRFLGAPAIQNIAARSQRIFDNGSGRDEYLKRDMKKSGLSVIQNNKERKIVIELYRIRGEIDDLIRHPLTGELFIIDFKTMHHEAFKELNEAKVAHALQVMPYMFAKEVYKAFILYEDKDNQELKAMPANFDSKIWEEKFVQRIARILDGIDKNTVYRNPVSCSRCPFFESGVCAANRIEELKVASGLYATA